MAEARRETLSRSKRKPRARVWPWPAAYSNSAEFDAALIAARRAAGVYGPRRHRRQMLTAAAAIAAGLTVLAFLIL